MSSAGPTEGYTQSPLAPGPCGPAGKLPNCKPGTCWPPQLPKHTFTTCRYHSGSVTPASRESQTANATASRTYNGTHSPAR